MKVSRRGLGGLFAGAAAAIKLPTTDSSRVVSSYPLPPPVETIPTQIDPTDQLQHYLIQQQQTELDHYPKRRRWEEKMTPDPDVTSLRSLSPSGRDLVQRTRWGRKMFQEQQTYLQSEINSILERHPYLRYLVT